MYNSLGVDIYNLLFNFELVIGIIISLSSIHQTLLVSPLISRASST